MTLAVRSLVVLGAVLATCLPVRAQDLPAPATLQRVFVLPATGHGELEGRLLDLGHDSMALLVKGQRIEVPLKDVVRIQLPGDSVKNGALIGALVGGLWAAWLCSETDSRFCTAAVGINAAFGAAIGAGIDAMIPGRTTIYNRPSAPRARIGLAPRAAVGWRFRF